MDRLKNPVLKEEDLVEHFLNRVRYGLKSKYYQNSLTGQNTTISNLSNINQEVVIQPNERANCASGSCAM
jgi:hypothetical protein